MEDIYKALSSRRVRGHYGHQYTDTIQVSELCVTGADDTVWAEHRSVPLAGLEAWLNSVSINNEGGNERQCFARIVWVERNHETMRMNIPSESLTQILDSFDLHLADEYSACCLTGIDALKCELPASGARQSYSFSYSPKLAMIWGHTPSQQVSSKRSQTDIVIYGERTLLAGLRPFASRRWNAPLATHPGFPVLLCTLLLGQQVDITQEGIKVHLRGVEVRTGHHQFKNRFEDPATGQLSDLSALMSGCETKLASVERKLKTMEELCKFMSSNMEEREPRDEASPGRAHEQAPAAVQILDEGVKVLRQRIHMQGVDNDYILQRVRIQINALFNLTTLSDGLVSLKTAQATQLTAISAQRDASSMKTLAVVTMFFLPGSFVSALLATPLFDWDASPEGSSPLAVTTRPQFGLYWAITIPLTVATFTLYGLWVLFQKMEHDRASKEAERQLAEPSVALAEAKILSMRRDTLLEK